MERLIFLGNSGIMMRGALVGAVLAPVWGIWYLIVAGLRNGDRPRDTNLDVKLEWDYRFEHWVLKSTISVSNPSDAAVIISSRSKSVRRLMPRQAPRLNVTSPIRPRFHLDQDSTLLGLVEGKAMRWWTIPVAYRVNRSTVEVEIRVDQDHSRTRLFRYHLVVPPAPTEDTNDAAILIGL